MSAGGERPDLQRIDARPTMIESVHVRPSTAGIVYVRSAEQAWHMAVNTPTTEMPGSWGELPIRRDALVLPRWKVYARLINDIFSSPINEVIGWQLASLDEAIWRNCAQDWEP